MAYTASSSETSISSIGARRDLYGRGVRLLELGRRGRVSAVGRVSRGARGRRPPRHTSGSRRLRAAPPAQRRTLVPLISSIGCAIVVVAILRGIFGVNERRFPAEVRLAAPITLGPVTFTIFDLDDSRRGDRTDARTGLRDALDATRPRDTRGRRRSRGGRAPRGQCRADDCAHVLHRFGARWRRRHFVGVHNSVLLDMGGRFELKGLAVIILGGMGSVSGAVAGGFILGITETLAVAFIDSHWRDAIAFGVMFLILILRPTGLFGRRALRAA